MASEVAYPSQTEAAELISELCKLFYDQGWVSGTGGGISVRCGKERISMAPSGVQKERMRPEDMYLIDASSGEVVETPAARPPPYKPPKLSECAPLFMLAYELRDAGAVMHSHSANAVLATLLDPVAKQFKCTHLEMMKGISGHGYYDTMVVPIIENTARECELTERMREAMLAYPKSSAVLVRRHGVYVWGRTWIEAKTQAECYDYLFGIAVRMAGMGTNAAVPPGPVPVNGSAAYVSNGCTSEGPVTKRLRGSRHPKCVVLDIEGTLAPITFVTETLFPYAKAHVQDFLVRTFDEASTQDAVNKLRLQAREDVSAGFPGAREIDVDNKEAAVASCVANVEAQMAVDRKTTALKNLQGLIWTEGYKKGNIKGQVFRDVPDVLQVLRDHGIKSYIYSSGSRRAQRDLFAHTQVGDLRHYLMGFFDTTVGQKRETASYEEIACTLAVDHSSDILFATDVVEEAQAAAKAGWKCVLVTRPGNKPLRENHGFPVIEKMDELLAAY